MKELSGFWIVKSYCLKSFPLARFINLNFICFTFLVYFIKFKLTNNWQSSVGNAYIIPKVFFTWTEMRFTFTYIKVSISFLDIVLLFTWFLFNRLWFSHIILKISWFFYFLIQTPSKHILHPIMKLDGPSIRFPSQERHYDEEYA